MTCAKAHKSHLLCFLSPSLVFRCLFSLSAIHSPLITSLYAAVPETITYQGTLRKSGAIFTGIAAMEFKVTNQDGSATYWTSGSTNVAVSAGLFRYPFGIPNEAAFQVIDWSSIVPYVEVTIDGITLPREPLYSSPYSLHSKTSEGKITGTLNAGIAGIGTSSPQSRLHILDGDIRISTSAGQSSRGIIFQDGSVQNTASGSAQWATSGANLYNTNAGNMGIGTSAPGQKLEVIGTAKATAFEGNGSALTNITASNITGGSFANAAYTFPNNITVSGSLGAGLNAGGFKITNLAEPAAAQDGASKNYVDSLTGGGLPSAVLSATQTFTGQDTFLNQVVASSHLFINAGNVGVGTASPPSKLSVAGDIRITAGSGGQIVFADGSTMSSAGTGSAASISNAADAIVTGDSDASASGDVILKTGSSDRLHVLNNGNVGVGTANPGYKLVVAGNSVLQLDVSNAGYVSLRAGGIEAARIKP